MKVTHLFGLLWCGLWILAAGAGFACLQYLATEGPDWITVATRARDDANPALILCGMAWTVFCGFWALAPFTNWYQK